MKLQTILLGTVALLSSFQAISSAQAAEQIALPGPDGTLTLTVALKDKHVGYTLARGDTPLLQWAPLGITLNGTDGGANIADLQLLEKTGPQTVTFPVAGVHAEGKVNYTEYHVGGLNGQTLRVRVFPNGAAFRYEFPTGTTGTVNAESTGYGLTPDTRVWTQDGKSAVGPCEGVFTEAPISSFAKTTLRSGPFTAVAPDGTYLAFQEAESFGLGWSGIKYNFDATNGVRVTYYHDPKGFPHPGTTHTPWRVVHAARDLNTLVNTDIVSSLVPAPDATLFPQGAATAWVKPGRSTWSWWATSRATYNDQLAFTNLAADLGYEYNLVDEGWEGWKSPGKDKWAMLRDLSDYAAKKNVKIWVWKRWSQINNPTNDWAQMRDFFDKVKAAGAVGLKVDFMDSQSQSTLRFYDAVLRNTAARQLMINFHGANPPSGEKHSWPNEMSREGIYGLEQNKWGAIPAGHYAALPFTRLIAGHADFTPGYFGTRHNQLDGSSWAQQLACAIVYTTSALHIVSPPSDVRSAAPAGSPQLDLLKNLPTLWDETRVLPGADIGKFAPYARRKGNVWYVGVINGAGVRNGTLKLDFLAPGVKYKAIIIADDLTENATWQVSEAVLGSADALPFALRSSGGLVVRLTPVK